MSSGILVKDAMVSNVVIANPEQTVMEGADIMRRKDVGSLIICENSRPVGIVTREDIVNKVTAQNLMAKDVKLKDIMNKSLVITNVNEDLADVARKMTKYGYERLPVIQDGRLVGIISDREIVKIAPSAIEILRERLMMDDSPAKFEESTNGDCEFCGNFSDDLHEINGKWVCEECEEEAETI